MKTILIISPHLDDAVLSCGATIAALHTQGHHITTATVFTHPGTATDKHTHYSQRRQQDEQALALLGAACIHLGFVDAPFRHTTWNSFSTLLFHHHTPPHQLQLVQDIAAAINTLIQQLQPHEVWYPLGVGGHIDHHLVWHSSTLLNHLPTQHVFYEECPYAMVPGWAAIRWNSIGAKAITYGTDTPVPYSPLTQIPLPFIHNYITNAHDKQASLAAFNKEWQAQPPQPFTVTQWQLNGRLYTQSPSCVPTTFFQQQCKAIACYTTEWPALFGPQEQHIAETLSQNIHNHQYCGQYWYKN
ncbi:LmbE family N-acetylglucosaminyl deacetylase [Filimonas zeae]|uniref:N-acetylglucosaminyl deacetylase, LmbE family n=1 Tax=Filimonas zeae TaxID=1737353 RepID=A0A917MQW6_9BACT|nr:PIG-L family deacetylase [Filimonas zeae]MDR6337427.1 LmbE family N-acetylglucosaminyl deacetylase [Filimonas zeae]GGH58569.1 hypothetical protein GCM10011379_04410 [Filimonas zeae]